MRLPLTVSTIPIIIITVLIVCLSAENDGWYSRIGRGLMDLTSSTSPLATTLNTLIGQKNPFSAFDIFLNQTRRIIPTIATFGNFTLLQAALVCAVGAIAAGAATFAAEAVYFKIQNDQEQNHVSNYHVPQIVYGNNQQHFRRNYEDDSTQELSVRKQLQKRYPTKSLKRTQRRFQRKNKNSGDQLEKLFPTI